MHHTCSLMISGVIMTFCMQGCYNNIKSEDAGRIKFRGFPRRTPCRRRCMKSSRIERGPKWKPAAHARECSETSGSAFAQCVCVYQLYVCSRMRTGLCVTRVSNGRQKLRAMIEKVSCRLVEMCQHVVYIHVLCRRNVLRQYWRERHMT